MPASITTSVGTTAWSGVAFWKVERRSSSPDAAAASFLVGLSSVYWREAWKYGVRAFRYCQHDVGHALAAIRYAAAALGWSARLLADVSDAAIAVVLGLTEPESFSAIAGAGS